MKYLSCICNRAIVDLEENRKNRTSACDGFYSLSVSLSLTHSHIFVFTLFLAWFLFYNLCAQCLKYGYFCCSFFFSSLPWKIFGKKLAAVFKRKNLQCLFELFQRNHIKFIQYLPPVWLGKNLPAVYIPLFKTQNCRSLTTFHCSKHRNRRSLTIFHCF